MELIYSLQSEWIKSKNSAVLWLTILGAFLVPFIILISRIVQHTQTIMLNSSQGIWMKLFRQNWQFMAVFLLPMGIILASSLITQIEYRNNTWKQLYTSPQRLSTIFLAKYIIVLFILLLFFILFNIGIYITGALPALIYHDIPYPKEAFPFMEFLEGNLKFLLYCSPILAIQYLMSLHIRNFVIAIGVGIALLVISLIAINYKYGYVIPYTYCPIPFLLADNKTDASVNITHWALAYFLFFSVSNYLIFVCKTQSKSSFFKLKPLLFTLLFILITGIIAALYFGKHSDKSKIKDNTSAEITENIKSFEQNLGAFKLKDNEEWTLKSRMNFYKVKGLSIAVVHNYKIEWAKGYGYADEAAKIPVTENTIFEPGSLSKSVNAMALMKLVQEKKINLFEDINQYLKTWKFPYDSLSKGKKITLANLLSHTAGIGVHGFEGYKYGDSLPTISEILDGRIPAKSIAVRSIFEPGKRMEYSGGGIMISQQMLMDVTGQAYDKYMYENILLPLKMVNSFYTQPIPENKQKFAAIGYDSLGNALPYKYPIMAEQAAAGLWTTPTDMCKFIIEFQLSLKGKSNIILDKQNTQMMLTPYIDERAALGFFINDNNGTKYFGHDAGNWGFSGSFYGSMEGGNGIAVFINSENSQILQEIINSIADIYYWNGFVKKQNISPVVINEDIFKKYAGEYKNENQKVKIYEENGSYFYETGNEKRKIYFINNNQFINMENPSVKKFNIKEDGSVIGFTASFKDKKVAFTKIE